MTEPKSFASLTPSLLARKGGARPAMRPQLQPIQQFHEATARQIVDDLGWNDMGDEAAVQAVAFGLAEVIALNPDALPASANVPEVVRQQERIAQSVAAEAPAEKLSRPRRSALAAGRRAAFTLRLDADRHLQLRLASTLANRSAQQIVTDALDRLLSELSDVARIAAQVKTNN